MKRLAILILLIMGCVTEPQDCAGVAGGTAGLDSCAVCVGGTTNLTPCPQDCADVWGGTAVEDDCGVCDSDATNDCEVEDCDPELICGQALTCCDGLLYPTTCCDSNCDEPIEGQNCP